MTGTQRSMLENRKKSERERNFRETMNNKFNTSEVVRTLKITGIEINIPPSRTMHIQGSPLVRLTNGS